MLSLTTFLKNRLLQLEQRKMMIPRYVERPGSFLGRTDFSIEDLPKIQQEINECKAALKAVEACRKGQMLVVVSQTEKK